MACERHRINIVLPRSEASRAELSGDSLMVWLGRVVQVTLDRRGDLLEQPAETRNDSAHSITSRSQGAYGADNSSMRSIATSPRSSSAWSARWCMAPEPACETGTVVKHWHETPVSSVELVTGTHTGKPRSRGVHEVRGRELPPNTCRTRCVRLGAVRLRWQCQSNDESGQRLTDLPLRSSQKLARMSRDGGAKSGPTASARQEAK